ncbi:MAG: FG-GAP repeat protein [Planctomycetaceae bacterium]|nr:FG-GAP repeat protein [Planctomycetaceae bacterium]
MAFDWLRTLRAELTANFPLKRHRWRVRRGAKRQGFQPTEALESLVMLAGAIGEVTSFSKISDTEGNFTAVLNDLSGFGSSIANLGDLDGDGIVDFAVGAEGDDDGGNARGAVYVLFLNADDTVKAHQKISDTSGGFTAVIDDFDQIGSSLANVGDIDGDGITDLAVGATNDGDGGSRHGAVYVLFLNANGTVKSHQKISDTQGNFTATLDAYDFLGRSLTNLGDLDGDGVTDLAVGADGDSDGGTYRGAVYVLFMNTDGTVKSHQKISDTAGGFTGSLDDGDYFGASVANTGDLDGDGISDLAVGAVHDGDGGLIGGAVYVLFLNANGTVKSHQKISNTAGGFTAMLGHGDSFGNSLANLGDVDGDGIAELAVGTYFDDAGTYGTFRGAVYILSLEAVTPPGVVTSFSKISDTAGNFTAALGDGDRFGVSVTSLGDLDGDGINDLAAGARSDDDGGSNRGAVYVLFLNADGTVKSHQKISDTAGNFTATLDDSDLFGISVTNLGDLDGDGITDLAVGARNDDDGGLGHGAVYVLFLNTDGTVKSHQKISDTAGNFTAILDIGDYFGKSLANLGDLDGDGINDLAVGSFRDGDGSVGRGAVYVLLLNADGTVKSHQKISDTQGNFTATLNDSERFGNSVANLGDLDGDGINELAVGAGSDGDGGNVRGAVYILSLAGVSNVRIVDDGDPGFSTFGPWAPRANAGAFEGDTQHRPPNGLGESVATWEFTGLVPGTYHVAATWFAHANRASNSPFTVRETIGGAELDTVLVNQKVAPNDFNSDGADWENLTVVTITGTTLVVELRNSHNDGYVVADAIRIAPTNTLAPPIDPIIDDGEPGFTTIGSWSEKLLANGRHSDVHNSLQGNGSDKATWTFTGLMPGNYLVSATWTSAANRATNAPFTIFDGTGGPAIQTRLVNQKLEPNDFSQRGSTWERLAVVTITGNELVVELTDDANGYVIADAIFVQATTDAPNTIIDNGDPGFTSTPGWTLPLATNGYDGDQLNASKGDGSRIATWTFTDLTPGLYRVSATWTAFTNRATDAPYTIFDGAAPLATVDINQQLTPDDRISFGASWEDLATVMITSNTLTVQLTDEANGFVIADAVRIERVV